MKIKKTMATKADLKENVENRKMWAHDHRFNELEPKVEDHEKRLTALESPKSF